MTTEIDVSSSEFDFLDRAEPLAEQGSAQWLQQRIGKVTGSRIKDVMAYLKSGKGEMQTRANYRVELIAEILTGQAAQHFVSDAMRWGVDQEQFARAAYEMRRDVMVDRVGFVGYPTIDRAGGSPDGLVGSDGGVEIKCPETTTHIRWMLEKQVPHEHQLQMMFYMACTGRGWWDFVSFDPRLPVKFQLFTVRLQRDEARIAEVETEVLKFLQEIDSTIAEMERIAG
jgi:hypothetical protein